MRLDRRLRILRGKRQGAFDPAQRAIDRARRARTARKVRLHLRRLEPVVLITPRWSQAQRFLDDIAVDLGIGKPEIYCRTLSLLPLQSRSVQEAWTWLVQAITEFCSLPLDGPVATAVDRHGFRHVMGGLFRRTARGPIRGLLIHGMEHLPVEARDDLIRVFEDHCIEAGAARRIVLLFAGSVDAPTFTVQGATRLWLPDFAEEEALQALAEYTGPCDRARLERIVEVTGGVPAVLDKIGNTAGERDLAADPDLLWRTLGTLADEIRGAVAIVTAVDGLAERLELVAKTGPVAEDAHWDRMLLRAGLFTPIERGKGREVQVRAKLFVDLAAR